MAYRWRSPDEIYEELADEMLEAQRVIVNFRRNFGLYGGMSEEDRKIVRDAVEAVEKRERLQASRDRAYEAMMSEDDDGT